MGSELYNVAVYNYVDSKQIRLYDKVNERAEKREKKTKKLENDTKEKTQIYEEHSKEVSINRTIQSIYGITRANKWYGFITLTFDPKKIDSTDITEVSKYATEHFKYMKKAYCPNLYYILVPELHSDGKKIHIHGLVGGVEGLPMVDSGIVKNGKIIYNLPKWKHGFSTLSLVEHQGKVSRYITKYITKELVLFTKGKKRYWASRNCLRANDVCDRILLTADEKTMLLEDIAPNMIHLKKETCSYNGQGVTYIEFSKE